MLHNRYDAMQEAVVCVLDVSKHMASAANSPTHFKSALRALELLIQQKVRKQKEPRLRVVFVPCCCGRVPVANLF